MTKLARIKILALCLLLTVCSVYVGGSVAIAETQPQKGVVTGDGVRVRKTPGTENKPSSDVVAWVYSGQAVDVYDTVKHTDGYNWYNISFIQSGQTYSGYIRSDFVNVYNYVPPTLPEDYTPDADFEAYMDSQGFPESYKDGLRYLHMLHPEWILVADKIDLDWETVLYEESKVGRNMVSKNEKDSWKSMEDGAYDWEKGEWIELDTGWVAAAKDIIAYYLDPRNFLTETGAFLFVSHTYNANTQNVDDLGKMLVGTFMEKPYPEDEYDSYAQAIMKAGEVSGVNPYVLASMIIVEQGANGAGNSISGTVSGQEGYYNFFNIGAFKGNVVNGVKYNDAVRAGLAWAANTNVKPEYLYSRAWDTRAKSILGGAQWYFKNYVSVGQNTHYYKKFNVVNAASLYEHQYMTNIEGAYSEAAVLKKAYKDVLDTPIVFSIPIYKNMPEKPIPMPDSESNNNNLLNSLSVSGYNLTPSFSPSRLSYELLVPHNTTSVSISASPSDPAASVSGAGNISVGAGDNLISIVVTAPSGSTRTYTINVHVESERKKGDVSGDGKISILDLAKVQNYILEKETFSDTEFYAADVNSDGKVSILDLAKIQMHILGTQLIG